MLNEYKRAITLRFLLFTDLYCEHRPKYICREPPFLACNGPMSPPVSASLGGVSLSQDGGVGMPIYITVTHVHQIKGFPFDDIGVHIKERMNCLYM